MEPLAFNADRIKSALLILAALVGVPLASYFLTTVHNFYVILPVLTVDYVGWAGLAFSVFLPFILQWRLLGRGPHLVIDDDGLDDRAGGFGIIPWSDIQQFYVAQAGRGRGKYLCIVVPDPNVYLRRLNLVGRLLARANPAFGITPVMINFSQLHPGLDSALPRITTCVQAYRAAREFHSPSPEKNG